MGLILDTSVLIANERAGRSPRQMIERVESVCGRTQTALSAVSVVELTHGIYRAKTDFQSGRRRAFAAELYSGMIAQPVSLEIAQLAGKIEGEEAARGNSIAFEDLLIGATALYLGFDVATINLKHFQQVPGLRVVAL